MAFFATEELKKKHIMRPGRTNFCWVFLYAFYNSNGFSENFK
ncbi:hypothetical protein CLU96_3405 [Chryseobacterium sp. 52]|nr:hypothetical protein CLU96_3405 [Chryseobacterium sp. 52]